MHAGFPTVAAVYDRRFFLATCHKTGGHRPPLQWKNGPEYLSALLTRDTRNIIRLVRSSKKAPAGNDTRPGHYRLLVSGLAVGGGSSLVGQGAVVARLATSWQYEAER